MLNEERVKHMTKLAFYESKGGSEDLKVSFRYKKDYIGVNVFWSALWMTIAYIALVVLVIVTFMNGLFKVLSSQFFGNLLYYFDSVHQICETCLRKNTRPCISSHEKVQ